jgi:hypothetical protein
VRHECRSTINIVLSIAKEVRSLTSKLKTYIDSGTNNKEKVNKTS